MNLRQRINDCLRLIGYRIVRAEPDVAHAIARGRYDWLRRRRIATVLDVGANIGQFATIMRQVFPVAMIHAFEPLESCLQELQQKSQALQPIQFHPIALGHENARMTIHRNQSSASSSILHLGDRHREAFPGAKQFRDEIVDVHALDSIAPSLKLELPILLKIDVQGYELRVLEGAVTTLSSIDLVIVETSFTKLYEGQSLFDEVYQFLRALGFEYVGSLGQVHHPASGEVLQEDSVFTQRSHSGSARG